MRMAARLLTEHSVARLRAYALLAVGADGILYESARTVLATVWNCLKRNAQSPALAVPRKVGSSDDNAPQLAKLLPGVSIIGG
jgi:hypothetical protein